MKIVSIKYLHAPRVYLIELIKHLNMVIVEQHNVLLHSHSGATQKDAHWRIMLGWTG